MGKKTPTLTRLTKYLAERGMCSRRNAEQFIREGRVHVNGEPVIDPAHQVLDGKDEVELNGIPLETHKIKKHYYKIYKPREVVTTLFDPKGRFTVGKMIEPIEKQLKVKLFPVGRLDYDAEGILLITNDGDMANRLLHPKYKVEKTYMVKVKGKPLYEDLNKLVRGVTLEDGKARAKSIKLKRTLKKNAWVEITLTQGRYHIVKRMFMRIGYPVTRLFRTHFAGIDLRPIKVGMYAKLSAEELDRVKPDPQPK